MTTETLDFEQTIVAGATHVFDVDLVRGSPAAAVPLTGASAECIGKRRWADATALFELTSSPAAGVELQPASVTGRVRVTIPPSATAALEAPSQLRLAVNVTESSGRVTKYRGLLNIAPTA